MIFSCVWMKFKRAAAPLRFYPAVVKVDSEVGVRAARGRPLWTDHGRSHRGLPVLPERVLTEDEVGEVEWETRRLFDSDLRQRKQVDWRSGSKSDNISTNAS